MTWVKPDLVCQVKYANWTQDDHLRAPVYWPSERCGGGSGGRKRRREGSATSRSTAASLKFTNLSKVYYPDEGFTKRDVLNYYDGVARLILPHLKDRPLSLKRYPNGIKQDYFFQKNVHEAFAPWLRTELIDSTQRTPINYVSRRPRQPALSGQPRLHRSQPVDEPLAAVSIIRTSC